MAEDAPTGGLPKMADIARLAGVSVSTVSRALADSPLIPAARRTRIQELAAQAGYVVNQPARALRLRRTETIAIVLPLGHEAEQLVTDPFFLDLFGHLVDEITLREHQVLISRVTKPKPGWLDRLVRSQRQDGVLVIGQSDQHEALQETAARHRAMVVWGGRLPGQTYCSVGVDNVGGGRLATAHLIARGRRRIAWLGPTDLPETRLRRQGHAEALAEAGLPDEPALVFSAPMTEGGALEAARAMLATGARFDALFAATDVIALQAMRALAEAGRSVPADVAVAGFDDIAAAAAATPALTTVRQDRALAARVMVETLFARMAGQDAPSALLPTTLIARASSLGPG
jgi:DNA-binding LacI/PurR family transcriptional regulator